MLDICVGWCVVSQMRRFHKEIQDARAEKILALNVVVVAASSASDCESGFVTPRAREGTRRSARGDGGDELDSGEAGEEDKKARVDGAHGRG